VAENREALRSLMQLHPLNLTKPDSATLSQPPSPNPLLDTNPFGAVPLSALLQSPATTPHNRQTSRGGGDDSGHFGGSLGGSAAQTPELCQRHQAKEGKDQSAMEPSVFQRQAAVQASSFADLVNQQVSGL